MKQRIIRVLIVCILLVVCIVTAKTPKAFQPQELSYPVVRVLMGQYAGCGIVWCCEEDRVIIAANRHLLKEAPNGVVELLNGVSFSAEVVGFSQEYDLGFLQITIQKSDRKLFRAAQIKDAETLQEKDTIPIIQTAILQPKEEVRFEGVLRGLVFVPEFQTFMLETECYAMAGMSGGGVFDEEGKLLGMIAGGKVETDSMTREAMITYSIPAMQIEKAYQNIKVGV